MLFSDIAMAETAAERQSTEQEGMQREGKISQQRDTEIGKNKKK